MSTYIECEECGKMSMEVIGDQQLGCENCEAEEEYKKDEGLSDNDEGGRYEEMKEAQYEPK